MSSSWLNKAAIFRDLSRAQGCVPVEVAGAVAAADLPPSPDTLEDNEEEFFRRNFVQEDGDFGEPDLNLIKHMLNVVQEFNSTDDDTDKVIEICNIRSLHLRSPKAGSGEPIHASITKENPKAIKTNTKKPSRNVAIMSLLQNQEKGVEEEIPKSVKNAIEKVNGWFDVQDKQTVSKPKKKVGILDLDSLMFFKKRASPEKPDNKVENNVKSPLGSCKNYVPSERALEYYKKCKEKSKMKELVVDDVWAKVEKHMKAIDEQRNQFKECLKMTKNIMLTEPTSLSVTEFDDPKYEAIRLPQHRHSLVDQCMVCAVKIFNEKKEISREADSVDWRKKPQTT